MEIFMIHLCTIATLMFLQNNTSQKILFIAARTIQFPGVVFKVCIYLIVAIVTSSIYFDVKSTHTYRKYIYQQSDVEQEHILKGRQGDLGMAVPWQSHIPAILMVRTRGAKT